MCRFQPLGPHPSGGPARATLPAATTAAELHTHRTPPLAHTSASAQGGSTRLLQPLLVPLLHVADTPAECGRNGIMSGCLPGRPQAVPQAGDERGTAWAAGGAAALNNSPSPGAAPACTYRVPCAAVPYTEHTQGVPAERWQSAL